jgi:hypothetical protein
MDFWQFFVQVWLSGVLKEDMSIIVSCMITLYKFRTPDLVNINQIVNRFGS